MSVDEPSQATPPAPPLHLALPPALLRLAIGGPGLIVVAGPMALRDAAVDALAEHRRRVGPGERAVLLGTLAEPAAFDAALPRTLQALCLAAAEAVDAEELFALLLQSGSVLALSARVRALVVVRDAAGGPVVDLLGAEELARRWAARPRPPLPSSRPAAAVHPAAAAPFRLPPAPGAAPASPAHEAVQFRAYAPPGIAPGNAGLVDIWACLPSQAEAVARLAKASAQPVAEGLRAGVSLVRGAVVTVRLRVEGLRVKPASQPLVWDGEPANVSFVVAAPDTASEGRHRAIARLVVDGMTVGDLHFLVTVAAHVGDPALTDTQAAHTRCRSAFASYAAEDRAEVLARVQGMKAVAPELDIFLDVLSLRAGERWQQRIEREVSLRDRLFLFWSGSARASRWVDFEWRLAQRLKGIDAIDPVPLVDPRNAPPPAELSALHFGDAFVEYIAGVTATAQRAD